MFRPGRYYIIEHPTKGVLRELEQMGDKLVPRYSWRARRNSPNVMRFTDLQQTVKLADGLKERKGKKQIVLHILKAPHWKVRCWDCGGWIDTSTGRELGHRRGCPHVGGGD